MPVPRSLYLHLPFCAARCPYCDFAISTAKPSEGYADALRSEIRDWGKRLDRPGLSTLHLGGGTPSRMPLPLLTAILDEVRASFRISRDAEVAIECNPSDAGAFAAFPALGINRLSLGAQSFDDRELGWLGRDHDAGRILLSAAAAREAGIRNLSLDLIYGLPGQDLNGWKRTMACALALRPEHLSVYALTLTGAKRLPGPPCPGEEVQAAMAMAAIRTLEKAGLKQYEISNFAKPGFESRHNLAYWTFQPYLGLGVSAHSYLPPRRFANVAQTPEYVARIRDGKGAQGFEEVLDAQKQALERLFLGLRLTAGLEPAWLPAEAGEEVEALKKEKLLVRRRGRWALTPKGRIVADAVTARLVRCLPESKELQRVGA